MKKNAVAIRFALIVGLIILLPFVMIFTFGGIGVMRGGGRIAGVLRTRDGWDLLLYALIAAIGISSVLFLVLRRTRRT